MRRRDERVGMRVTKSAGQIAISKQTLDSNAKEVN